jgi:hypothetical protein
VAHRLDWLAVFILAFTVILEVLTGLFPVDKDAFAAGLIASYGLGGSFLTAFGLLLATLLLALAWLLALGWLVLRLLFVGQYRLVKAGCLLLCGVGLFVLSLTGPPFLSTFNVLVLLLFLTTR